MASLVPSPLSNVWCSTRALSLSSLSTFYSFPQTINLLLPHFGVYVWWQHPHAWWNFLKCCSFSYFNQKNFDQWWNPRANSAIGWALDSDLTAGCMFYRVFGIVSGLSGPANDSSNSSLYDNDTFGIKRLKTLASQISKSMSLSILKQSARLHWYLVG